MCNKELKQDYRQTNDLNRKISSLVKPMEKKGEGLMMMEVNDKCETRYMFQMLFLSKMCLIFV